MRAKPEEKPRISASNMVQLRSCLAPPPYSIKQQDIIEFRHPAYQNPPKKLLSLNAVDRDELWNGLDYEVALTACGIVACNRWEGWFSTKKQDGSFQRVPRPENGILPCPQPGNPYYFFVSDDVSEKYPIVPSFEHWPFPHNALPKLWEGLSSSLAFSPNPGTSLFDGDPRSVARMRDGGCRITGFRAAPEAAHLVPVEAQGWFEHNGMELYCHSKSRPIARNIDDDANMISLRRDLHFLFDQRRFSIVPKKPTSQDAGLQQEQVGDPRLLLFVHILLPDRFDELCGLYHNRPLQPVSGLDVRPEFLFARFAWSIFCDEHCSFGRGPQSLKVSVLDSETLEREEKDLKSIDLIRMVHIFPRAARNRSVSPKKRKNESADDEEYWNYYKNDNDVDDDSDTSEEEKEEIDEPLFRGRSRWRACSNSSANPPLVTSSYSTFEGASPHTVTDSAHTPPNLLNTSGMSQGQSQLSTEYQAGMLTQPPQLSLPRATNMEKQDKPGTHIQDNTFTRDDLPEIKPAKRRRIDDG
ncbi:hypothetical protein HD806DRAFT_515595 [Xylariaceae sp. AK1471]|nr:hypothetical protein HD806DRAFT_515595 [Xylariaceae sp. AK1471]